MEKYKVNSIKDNETFIATNSYKKLYNVFQSLKTRKGLIIHVVGAPGTGKSANIYSALEDMNLNVYNVGLELDNTEKGSKEVFNKLLNTIMEDFTVKSEKDVYKRLSEFDAVLFADKFHDSHFLNENKVGFSKWTDSVGINAFYFYFLCILEYIKYWQEFKNINIILQTAWRVYIRGNKYDIFSDFGLLSKFLVNILKIFFKVTEISYSESETINIVKKHVKNADEDKIRLYIQKYGCKPRFICNAIEKD